MISSQSLSTKPRRIGALKTAAAILDRPYARTQVRLQRDARVVYRSATGHALSTTAAFGAPPDCIRHARTEPRSFEQGRAPHAILLACAPHVPTRVLARSRDRARCSDHRSCQLDDGFCATRCCTKCESHTKYGNHTETKLVEYCRRQRWDPTRPDRAQRHAAPLPI